MDELEKFTDPFVALLTLDAERRSLCGRALNKGPWLALMTPAELYGPAWILAYEALVQKWLPSADGKDYVSVDSAFSELAKMGVRFYDDSAVQTMTPTFIPPSLGIGPMFYVGD